ncbi:MAG: hypothetical protein J6Y78_15265 [Paludibacteraceae bacterium]|nr:hypothetical protein [Paludibacteraceae bacterium]
MADIKTCEQYVLGRLQEIENKNAELETELRQTTTDLNHLEEDWNNLISRLKKLAELRKASVCNALIIDFTNIWNSDDKDDYAYFKDLLDLEEPEILEEPETTSDDEDDEDDEKSEEEEGDV